MKNNTKIISLILSFVMIISVFNIVPFTAMAANNDNTAIGATPDEANPEPEYRYIVLTDGTAEIIGYTGTDTEIEIPSEIDGHAVSSIGENAFRNCSGLTRITISDSVTSIDNYAFMDCTSLNDINIPGSVTSIGDFAFYNCSKLINISIPKSVTSIGNDAFAICWRLEGLKVEEGNMVYDSRNNCNAIIESDTNTIIAGCKTSVIPDTVTGIDQGAFQGCRELTSITIPDSVTSIDNYAFIDCTSLNDINIPGSVTSIGDFAFYNCSKLINISIPKSVTSIGNDAFAICWGLESLTVEEGNMVYDSRNNCNAIIESDTNTIIAGCKYSVIPNTVTGIGKEAFRGCRELTSITIPSSVTYIGYRAFEACDGLMSVSIPASVVSIDSFAFSQCTHLIDISIPDSLKSIGEMAFLSCTGLKEIFIPDSVTSIGNNAFLNTAWYDNQPDGVVYAGKVAYCVKGESPAKLEIKDGTLGISGYAFLDCTDITDVTISDSVINIGDRAFQGCGNLTNVTIPDSVITIGNCAFHECTNLKSVTIPDSVTSIGAHAFGFYGNWGETTYQNIKIDGFTIYGYRNTEAESYANENGFSFVSLSENYSLGDVSADGKIDITDATETQKYVAELTEFTPEQEAAADTNGDGKVDITDATEIQKFVAELIDHFGK